MMITNFLSRSKTGMNQGLQLHRRLILKSDEPRFFFTLKKGFNPTKRSFSTFEKGTGNQTKSVERFGVSSERPVPNLWFKSLKQASEKRLALFLLRNCQPTSFSARVLIRFMDVSSNWKQEKFVDYYKGTSSPPFAYSSEGFANVCWDFAETYTSMIYCVSIFLFWASVNYGFGVYRDFKIYQSISVVKGKMHSIVEDLNRLRQGVNHNKEVNEEMGSQFEALKVEHDEMKNEMNKIKDEIKKKGE